MGLFSSQPSAIERKVIEATDENLTAEDWSRIIIVCDEVNAKPEKNASPAIEALQKRLSSPNGNVQLFSLTLLNALAQNCGLAIRREIASISVASTLTQMGINPTTHRSVIVRLVDILGQLCEQFKTDPTLGQIQVAYDRVCRAHPKLAPKSVESSSQNLASQFPKDVKHSTQPQAAAVNDDDEDEDLRLALELSLKEMGQPQTEVEAAAHRPLPSRHKVRALYDFTATEDGELSFQAGDVIEVIDRVYKEWWRGLLNGTEGIFPVNYVEEIAQAPCTVENNTSASLYSTGDANTTGGDRFNAPTVVIDEEYIFAQVPAVEKLLSMLVSANQTGEGGSIITNREVQQSYHQIASMRPKLLQLIDEYTLKKQDLVDLNQKLLQARRSYEKLMAEASEQRHHAQMLPSQPSQMQPQSPAPAPYHYPQYTQPAQPTQPIVPAQQQHLAQYDYHSAYPAVTKPSQPLPQPSQSQQISQQYQPLQQYLYMPPGSQPEPPLRQTPQTPQPQTPETAQSHTQQSFSPHTGQSQAYYPPNIDQSYHKLPYPDDRRSSVPYTNGVPSRTL